MGVPLSFTPNGKFAYTVTSTNPGYFYAGNAVAGYSIASNGALTPITGSPFTDSNLPLTLTIDPSGTHLYTPGAQGGIAAFAIDTTTGSLAPLTGSPFATGPGNFSIGSLSIDVGGNFAYATNAGNGISAYSIDASNGALTALNTMQLDDSGTFEGITFDTTGNLLFVANSQQNSIAVFSIDGSTGALQPVPDSPYGPVPDASPPYLVK
jgi:6-phosphogluconolactonase (cycloisomerase 2 family)